MRMRLNRHLASQLLEEALNEKTKRTASAKLRLQTNRDLLAKLPSDISMVTLEHDDLVALLGTPPKERTK